MRTGPFLKADWHCYVKFYLLAIAASSNFVEIAESSREQEGGWL